MVVDIAMLISAIKSRPVLYNSKLDTYYSPMAKQQAWEQVSAEIDTSPDEAKHKWIKLRKCLISALNRRRKNNAMTPWKYDQEMKFLLPYLEYKTSEPVSQSDAFGDSSKDGHEYEENDEENIAEPYFEPVEIERVPSISKDGKSRSSCFIDLDDIDMFFLSLAKTVKQLPDYDQSRIKLLVSNAVLKTHMRHHKRQSHTPERSDSDSASSLSNFLTMKKKRTDQ